MRRGFLLSLTWLTVILLVATVSISWAQATRATLVGRVTDETGAVVPGSKLTLVNAATNETRSLAAGASGEFVFPQLAPGQYTLTTEHEGFRKDVRSGIVLEVGQDARLDVALRLGAVTEQVEVTASAPLISSENASIGNVVDQKKVVELPLNGRGYLQLALLQPNVFAPAQGSTIGFRGGINIAGSSEVANQYILDGVDNNDEASNQPLHTPILDAVQEFRVLTGTYSAEYGRQSGGQIIVNTKSGGNEFHGTAWDFYRNSVLDARNFFAPKKLSFIRSQYGATLGGPIIRNKSFFFVAWENQNRGNGVSTLATVPPVAFRNGDFSSLSTQLRDPFNNNAPFVGNKIPKERFSPQGAGLLALYPLPNLGSATNNIVASSKGHYDSDAFSTRSDHRFSEKDQIYGVYAFQDSNEFYALSNPLCSARSVPGWGCDEKQRTQHANLGWTHVFGPSLVNEARIGYVRFGFFRLQEDRNVDVVNALRIGGLTDAGKTPFNNGAPQISLTGYVTIGGPTNLPQGRHDNNYNYIENMTYIKGTHTMKFGVDVLHILFNSFFTSFGRGSFAFQPIFTGNSVADMLLGLPQQADRNTGEPFHNAIANNYGVYFQDDWKITPKLTLNYGLRYDLDPPETERVNKIASFDPSTNTIKTAQGLRYSIDPKTGLLVGARDSSLGEHMWDYDYNNFAPRVGIAYRPFGGTKTVVRAGFGSFYNHQITGNGITPLNRNSPFRNRSTAGPFTATTRPLPNLTNVFSSNVTVVPPGIQKDYRTAYTNEWSFGIQREVAQNLLLEVSYVGSESHKLPLPVNINQAFPGPGSTNSRRPFQGYGSITGGFISSIGNANFNSLQTRLERRFSKGLSFTVAYTFSKSIDQNGGISTSSNSTMAFAQDARNLRAERALSDYDVPHRFVFSYVWDLPYLKSNSFVNAVTNGWQLKGIQTLQAGQPFTVYDNIDQSATGGGSDRPNLVGNPHVSNQGVDLWFNPCTILANGTLSNCGGGRSPAWQVQPSGTFGNAGRNILRGPRLVNFDLGLSRQFKFTERIGLQFRAEMFNLANHPTFFLPTATVTTNGFGTITQAADQGAAGSQRQIQFALKVVF